MVEYWPHSAVDADASTVQRQLGTQPDLSRRIAFGTVAVFASLSLFLALYRQARTIGATSDGASNALQAWDMLHGNLLLRGWNLSDVSFYTTELPEYMLVESAHGLRADTVATATALTYTLIVILSVIAATGGSTGRARWIRGGLVVAALIAPATGAATRTLLASPDHTGTAVPVLATFILLDRVGARRWTPYAIGAMLAVFGVGDPLVLLVGAVPLAAISALRAARSSPERSFDVTLMVCAGAAVPVGVALVRVIRAAGGFSMSDPVITLIGPGDLAPHSALTIKSVLMLYSASFSGISPGLRLAIAFFHLGAVAIAAYGTAFILWRLGRGRTRLEEAIAVGVVVNLAAFVMTSMSNGNDVLMGREIAMVLPLSAILAARVVGDRTAGLRWSVAGVAVCVAISALSLSARASKPAVPAESQDAATWLAQHHLHQGLGGYWRASVITLATGGQVTVRPVIGDSGRILADDWESRTDWYRPGSSTMNFLVLDTRKGNEGYGTESQAVATFGRPTQRAVFHGTVVLVWDHDILKDLKRS